MLKPSSVFLGLNESASSFGRQLVGQDFILGCKSKWYFIQMYLKCLLFIVNIKKYINSLPHLITIKYI